MISSDSKLPRRNLSVAIAMIETCFQQESWTVVAVLFPLKYRRVVFEVSNCVLGLTCWHVQREFESVVQRERLFVGTCLFENEALLFY